MAKASVSKLVSSAGKTTVNATTDIAKSGVGLAKTGANTVVNVANTGAKAVTKVASTGAKAVTQVANKSVDTVSKVANTGVNTVAKVANTGVDVVKKVANKGVDVVTAPIATAGTAVSNTSKGVSKVSAKLEGLCNPQSIIPCITAITLIAYIVIVSPATVLDLFSNPYGKALSMVVVLIALLFDLKMGVMLGLAVVLSIALASVNKDLYESFQEEAPTAVMTSVSDEEDDDVVEDVVEETPSGPRVTVGIDDESYSCSKLPKLPKLEVQEGFKSGGSCYKPFKRSACKEKPNCFKRYQQKTCKEILGVPKGDEVVPVPSWSSMSECQYAPVIKA